MDGASQRNRRYSPPGATSRDANQRYLEALAEVQSDRSAGEVAENIFKRVTKAGRAYRALNPWSQKDGALLKSSVRGLGALTASTTATFIALSP